MIAAFFRDQVAKRAPEIFDASKMWRTSICSIGLSAFAFAALADEQNPFELVFRKSARIEAQLDGKSISIEAIDQLKRRIYINQCSYDVVLRPRQARWYGNLGGYNPGFSWKTAGGCAGLSRVVITEGQIHFNNLDFAKEWLLRRPKSYNNVFNDEGLVVSWGIDFYRSQISIDIDLMCYNGRNFDILKKIGIINKSSGSSVAHECAVVSPDEINDTMISLKKFWATYN